MPTSLTRSDKLRQLLALLIFLFLFLPPIRSTWLTHYGGRWLYIILFSFCLSNALTPWVRLAALRWGILDHPEARKIHLTPTPLLGGLPIFVAFLGGIFANSIFDWQVGAILGGAGLVTLTGLCDDIRPLPAPVKLLIHILATGLLMGAGIILRFFPLSGWGLVANAALTLLWMIGITNALNFLDGMDGLATGLAIITASFLGVVAVQTSQPFLGWLAAALVGSCLGFLPYNLRLREPAAIFLGDAGSNLLGFTLAALAVKGEWAEGNAIVSLATPILIFGVLIFDTTHMTIARIATGKVTSVREWLEYTGRDHLHHRLEAVFGSRRQSVLFIYGLSICLGLAAIALRNARTVDALLLIGQAVIITLLVTILEHEGNRRLR